MRGKEHREGSINLHYCYFNNCHHHHHDSYIKLHTHNRNQRLVPFSHLRPSNSQPEMQARTGPQLPKLDREKGDSRGPS